MCEWLSSNGVIIFCSVVQSARRPNNLTGARMQMILLIVMLSCKHVITSGTYVKAMMIRSSAGGRMARDYNMRVRSLVCMTINYIKMLLHFHRKCLRLEVPALCRSCFVWMYVFKNLMHHAQARATGVTVSELFIGAGPDAATIEMNQSIVCSVLYLCFGFMPLERRRPISGSLYSQLLAILPCWPPFTMSFVKLFYWHTSSAHRRMSTAMAAVITKMQH